jgi:hypothetical protein
MYHAVVRRALAVLLLGLFSFSLIPPSAFAADPEAGLPACCRRNGKHRCAIAVEGSSSGPALHTAACLFFPGAKAVSASPNAGVPGTALVSGFPLPSGLTNPPAKETPTPALFQAPRQQRGPPELSSY